FATFFDYDLLDRPLAQTRYDVDATGAITQTKRSRTCYDLAGDVRSVTAPKGDAAFPGCPAATTPYTPLSGNYTSSFAYDAAHKLLSTTDPLNAKQSLTYDADGNTLSFTDQRGSVSSRAYDQKDQLTTQ